MLKLAAALPQAPSSGPRNGSGTLTSYVHKIEPIREGKLNFQDGCTAEP